MNYSFDRLMGRAQEIFDEDPTSGHLFLFINRARDRMKILFWDRDGFCIWYKRLERGTFELLTTTSDEEGIELTYSQLTNLLGGLDLMTDPFSLSTTGSVRIVAFQSTDIAVRHPVSFTLGQ